MRLTKEPMRVLVACEFSGIVRDAFIAKGHDAVSCDLLPTEKPGPHIQGGVEYVFNMPWDMMIAFPPCTYLSYVGVRHWKKLGRAEKREKAMDFFIFLINAPIYRICIENPVGWPNTVYRKPDQIIHPYYFGEAVQKRTCLWLKNLPLLKYEHTRIEKPPPLFYSKGEKTKGKPISWVEGISRVGTIKDRQKARGRTFQGIANAMADQWG